MTRNKAAATARSPDRAFSEDVSDNELTGRSCSLQPAMVVWEFKCHRCDEEFENPVPRGPREEREIKCPRCGGQDIQRINIGKLQETACGG